MPDCFCHKQTNQQTYKKDSVNARSNQKRSQPIKRIVRMPDRFCPESSERDRWSSSQRLSVPDNDADDNNDHDGDADDMGFPANDMSQ